MDYVEAPNSYYGPKPSLFLAGGITGCPDWRKDVIQTLSKLEIALYNPRRESFDVKKKYLENEQIKWEYDNLRKASAILFWFPKESINPITLYELGAWSMSSKRLFVGVEPEYARKIDVEVQTKLARPDINVVYSLKDLSKQVLGWAGNG